jgi:hypothetical protein
MNTSKQIKQVQNKRLTKPENEREYIKSSWRMNQTRKGKRKGCAVFVSSLKEMKKEEKRGRKDQALQA